MTLRRVNVIILVLLAVAFLIVVQRNLLNLSDFLHKENSDVGMILPFESELSPDLKLQLVRRGDAIPVVITAVEDRLGAVVAAMNSVYQNSKANVVFTVVTLNDTVSHLKEWLSDIRLKHVKYRIAVFNPDLLSGKISQDPQILEATKPLTFARYYLPAYIPEAEKAIYLDDDVIVQGDIQELFETSLRPGHAAAFSDDCDSASSKGIIRGAGTQNNYLGFLDFKKEAIKTLGMRANTCSFNPGVIVVNLTEWKNQNITQQLEHWMELNTKEDLYSKTLAESIITPPLLIVFYKRHSIVDPMWHVRHLGSTGAGNRYSAQFVKAAKLLHWNGHYKPWGRVSSFSDVWDKWFIDDPTGKFHPVRRHSGDR
ncbi:glycosyltransferase 8 domain-containing protein 1 [Salarias fasciatus]|uniref:Glycosyltransferase 8 domain-containing protein 1 n=1 Tax=Salarias fasciatus TaxID=181472 RepID=A0A672IE21_SALFA|nr:glycosyltransferase 8 domain-containing protein 1 [Salarias fasciatus]XP_029948438.1 glycosyltransferase 8 domain-containing protein 1 [Salarias fasciatus]